MFCPELNPDDAAFLQATRERLLMMLKRLAGDQSEQAIADSTALRNAMELLRNIS